MMKKRKKMKRNTIKEGRDCGNEYYNNERRKNKTKKTRREIRGENEYRREKQK